MKWLDNYRARKAHKALVRREAELDTEIQVRYDYAKEKAQWSWDRHKDITYYMVAPRAQEYKQLCWEHQLVCGELGKPSKWFKMNRDVNADSPNSPLSTLQVLDDRSTKIHYRFNDDGLVEQVIERPTKYQGVVRGDAPIEWSVHEPARTDVTVYTEEGTANFVKGIRSQALISQMMDQDFVDDREAYHDNVTKAEAAGVDLLKKMDNDSD